MREKFCEKYFENNVKPKHLSEFCEKTPEGNIIRGYVCRKPNKYLGSLVITHITEKDGGSYETEQFVQSFPKIHYWDTRHQLKDDDETVVYYCLEKLDGTCLILYSLNNRYGESIEIIPKTRLKAVCDEHILEMYKLLDKKAINKFFKDNRHVNDTIMFELYGILNKHEITHIDTYIDIRLIGACIGGEFLDQIGIFCHEDLNDFQTPATVYTIEKNYSDNSFSVRWYGDDIKFRNYEIFSNSNFPTIYDAVQEIKVLLEKLNREYVENNGRRLVEGVVINGRHFKGGQMYLKIKPHDIELEARMMDSVPRRFILKETQKYFDEYGSKVRELYETDETHYINYIKHQLKEEFTYEQIEDPRTRKRIRKVFMEVWDSKIPPVSLQNICEELVRDNPDKGTADLMKIFAKTYPSKKSQSRFVYNILKAIEKRG